MKTVFAAMLALMTLVLYADVNMPVTTNYCTVIGPYSWGSAYSGGMVYPPKEAGGAITNGNLFFKYDYGVRWMSVWYGDYSCYDPVVTNYCLGIQSNLANIVIGSLVEDDEGHSIFSGDIVIPDILVGENKFATLGWAYEGSVYSGFTYGELGEHSFEGITSITFPEGYTTPSHLQLYGYYSDEANEVLDRINFWNLKELSFYGKPYFFSQSDYLHLLLPYLAYADQINVAKKYEKQWIKLLTNIGYGGRFHIIGSSITNRLNQAVAGPVSMVTTNVVIHYVQNSAQSAAVSPVTGETGFVNIITEIKGGNVAVPDSWATNYPNFVSRFGSDFTKALMMPTGKRDGAGNAMLVWQDYVAGTDPTKEDDVFRASITRDENGKIIISYTPEFKDANEKERRKYTTYGKKSLVDSADWEVVPEGHEADYNFFKVTVEMKP